ncbi:MAG: hypothetical protein HOG76_11910 [Candidatus Marinimicrobia bacterium]|nr:hypothetical protein [Candidatus Neomarinimicrobiota bacterium]MBT6003531.1 hypothetical protein [Candidatus Neomarinimicrobiota bacterium]
MITAVIFSATGLGVLNLATIVNLDTQAAVQTVQDQVEVESFANVALWRVNVGGDSLGNFTVGDISATYDSTTMKLSIMKTIDDETIGLILDLEEDSHFKRGIATKYWIDYNNRDPHVEPIHQLRDDIGFLPSIDWQYFVDNADAVHYTWFKDYEQDDLVEGINIFYCDYIDIEDVYLENTTLVFTGVNAELKDDVYISAPIIGGSPLPAIVLTNPYSDIHFDQGRDHDLRIEGAIFSNGHVRLHEGTFTGPVVSRTARMCEDIDMLDDQYPEYYEWNLGFGLYEDYDWPKQIQEWARID